MGKVGVRKAKQSPFSEANADEIIKDLGKQIQEGKKRLKELDTLN